MIALGMISLCLGIIGIFVPGLPTTSFLLLTAFLWVKSSEKLYNKLINNRLVGPVILDFQNKKGMTLPVKLSAISTMWIMITISIVFFIPAMVIKIIVFIVGIIGTVVMGFIVPTVRITKNDGEN